MHIHSVPRYYISNSYGVEFTVLTVFNWTKQIPTETLSGRRMAEWSSAGEGTQNIPEGIYGVKRYVDKPVLLPLA